MVVKQFPLKLGPSENTNESFSEEESSKPPKEEVKLEKESQLTKPGFPERDLRKNLGC